MKEDDEISQDSSKYKGCADCALGCDCLLWRANCRLCCGCLPPINQSTGTKIMYSISLIIFTALAALLSSSNFTKFLAEQDFWEKLCCTIDNTCDVETEIDEDGFLRNTNENTELKDECENILGATGVYLVYLSLSIFFVLMAMLTANLRHSHQWRASLHNGFWFWKFAIISGLFIGLYTGIAMNGPEQSFLTIWKWIALFFGSIFIFWQMTVFVNFAYDWGKSWGQAAERSETNCGTFGWKFAIWSFSFFLMGLTGFSYAVLFYAFTASPSGVEDDACWVNQIFILCSSAACGLLIIFALIPCGDRATSRSPTTGILQASLVAAYIMYLTFSAINAQTLVEVEQEMWPENHNGSCVERCLSLPDWFVEWLEDGENTPEDVIDFIASINAPCQAAQTSNSVFSLVFNYFAIGLTLFLTIYSATSSSSMTANSGGEIPPLFCFCYEWEVPEVAAKDVKGQDVIEDDYPRLSYRYWSFHMIYAAASMYLMMTLTNWFTPSDNLEESFKTGNETTFWIKAGTTAIIVVIYIGALMAPLFCPRNWFSKQLDGHAGQIEENSVVPDDLSMKSINDEENPYVERKMI